MPPDWWLRLATPRTPATDGPPPERSPPTHAHSCPIRIGDAWYANVLSHSATECDLAPLVAPTQKRSAGSPAGPPRAPPAPPARRHPHTLQQPHSPPLAPVWSCRSLPSPSASPGGNVVVAAPPQCARPHVPLTPLWDGEGSL